MPSPTYGYDLVFLLPELEFFLFHIKITPFSVQNFTAATQAESLRYFSQTWALLVPQIHDILILTGYPIEKC